MAESSFKLGRVAHVMLAVGDLARSLGFYRDRLGLSVRFQTPGFAFLEAGGVTLVLSEPMATASGERVGATEIVFGVDDVRGAYEALCERGVEFTQAPRNVTGTEWAANFADPDGHRLSVFGPHGAG